MRTKHPILRRDISRRQSRIERFRRCLCSVCAAGSQTVSAWKGDVPGGSLERLGEPSRYLTVVWNASMSEPSHPLCRGHSTRLVGLRRSLARPVVDTRMAMPPKPLGGQSDIASLLGLPARYALWQHARSVILGSGLTNAPS